MGSTVSKPERGSRPGDDGCKSEFCLTSPRPLPEESKARCARDSLTVGDTVTLLVDLSATDGKDAPGKGGGTYGQGRLEIEVRGRRVGAWDVPIIGITHQQYHVVAAVR